VFARLHTLATTPEQAERGLEIIQSVYLPWARESTGFRGLIRLFDRQTGKTLVLTLWADEEALDASSAAAGTLAERVAGASGADYRSLEDFEVTVLELHPDAGAAEE
jgi:heme-degrading monooxygenase HmoA